MERVAVSEFRANLVGFLKRVKRGEVITVTSRGHEIAKIMPPDNKMENARKSLKKLRKTAVIEDVLSPIEEEWEVMR